MKKIRLWKEISLSKVLLCVDVVIQQPKPEQTSNELSNALERNGWTRNKPDWRKGFVIRFSTLQ